MIEHGYAAAALSAIASRLGLTKGAFGHHFPTKQAIAVGIVERSVELTSEAAERAEQMFPDSAVRACIAYFGGIARCSATDPICAASLTLYQDRSVPVEVVTPIYESISTVVTRLLHRHVELEGGSLRMPPARAAQLLQMLIAGELTVARFIRGYSPADATGIFATALAGLGVRDADGVVADGIRAVWSD